MVSFLRHKETDVVIYLHTGSNPDEINRSYYFEYDGGMCVTIDRRDGERYNAFVELQYIPGADFSISELKKMIAMVDSITHSLLVMANNNWEPDTRLFEYIRDLHFR
jgi:hypothetical protein